jgi:transposase
VIAEEHVYSNLKNLNSSRGSSEMARSIGVDLHRNCFTACTLAQNGRYYLREWKLKDLDRFVGGLRPSDQIAFEVTGNARLFYDAVLNSTSNIVVVNPSQFKLISQSVKKTDKNDAKQLAFYLSKGMLPEVRMKDKLHAQVASLTQTRDKLVKLRTALKNKINNILSAHGINLKKESLSTDKVLDEVLGMLFDSIVEVELSVLVEQIRSLNKSIAKLDNSIKTEGQQLPGFEGIL